MLKSIRGKMLVYFITGSALALAALAMGSYAIVGADINRTVDDLAGQLADSTAQALDMKLESMVRMLKNVALNYDVQEMNWLTAKELLESVVKSEPLFKMLFLAKADGSYRTTLGGEGNIADRDYFKKIIRR